MQCLESQEKVHVLAEYNVVKVIAQKVLAVLCYYWLFLNVSLNLIVLVLMPEFASSCCKTASSNLGVLVVLGLPAPLVTRLTEPNSGFLISVFQETDVRLRQ